MIFRKLPKTIKKLFYLIFLKMLNIRDKSLKNNGMPSAELNRINVKNCKVVATREQLLENLPKHSICAEIGVNKGSFSSKILDYCSPKKLYLIDFWGNERYNKKVENHVRSIFKNEINNDLISINKGFSTEVLKSFSDNYFDWVYLDTSHTYETTIAELNILDKKIKEDGIIAGHDYVTRSRTDGMKYGVIEAVHQFCTEKNYEFLFITMEWHGHNSFAIKRLK